MNQLSWFKVLAAVILLNLNVYTCIENNSSLKTRIINYNNTPYTHNSNNKNSIRGGDYNSYNSYFPPKYQIKNTGKLPPEHSRRIHHRLRPPNYNNHIFNGDGPTHSRHTHSSHHSTYRYNSSNNLILLDISKNTNVHGYTIKHEPNKVIFEASGSLLFGKVVHGQKTLWKYRGQGYPYKVIYREEYGKPNVDIYFPESKYHRNKYRPPNFIPDEQSDVYLHEPIITREPPSSGPVKIQVPIKQNTPTAFNDNVLELEISTENGAIVMRPKLYSGGIINDYFLITVDIDKHESTDKIIYSHDQNTGIHTLKAKSPYFINKVVQKGDIVWCAKDNKYGEKVIMKIDQNGQIKAKILYPDWVSLNVSPPTLSQDTLNQYATQTKAALSQLSGITPITRARPASAQPGTPQQSQFGPPIIHIPTGSQPQPQQQKPTPTTQPQTPTPTTQPQTPTPTTQPQTPTPTTQPQAQPKDQTQKPVPASITQVDKTIPPTTPTPEPVFPVSKSADSAHIKPGISPTPTEIASSIDKASETPKSPPPKKEPEKVGVELDLNKRYSTDQYEYAFNAQQKTDIYTAKGLHRFKLIKYGTNDLWSTENKEEYANKAVLTAYEHPGMFDLFIYLDNSNVKKYYKDSTATWTLLDTNKINALSINALSKSNSFYYTVQTAGKYKTYTSKTGFRFFKIRMANKDIWETKNPQEYANKVVNENDSKIIIYMDNEKIKTFARKAVGCGSCKAFCCGLFTLGMYNCCAKGWKEVKK